MEGGVMEGWSDGGLEYWCTALLQHSITPFDSSHIIAWLPT